ncbi:MAG: hypothetical protein ABI068_14615 [Ktedonobacterales bacterium]
MSDTEHTDDYGYPANVSDADDTADGVDQADHDDQSTQATQPRDSQNVEDASEPTTDEPTATQSSTTDEADETAAKAETIAPHLRIEIGVAEGDFTLTGGAAHVSVHAPDWEDEDLRASSTGDGALRFPRLPDDVTLAVPTGAEVRIRQVEGSLTVDSFNGALEVHRVEGDADLNSVGDVLLNRVEGDLDVSSCGELRAREVEGDVTLSDARRPVLLGVVGGDLEASDLAGLEVRGAIGGEAEIDHCGVILIEGAIGGDAELRHCPGATHIGTVGGDLEASDLGPLSVATVGGELTLEDVSGDVTIQTVGGEADLRSIAGAVRINVVGGDLEARRIPGGLTVTQIGGDAEIETALGQGREYQLRAGGDVTLRVRGEVNARFVAQSYGGEIRTRLPLSLERGRRRNLVGTLGDGSATVTIQCGGDIEIVAAYGEHSERRDNLMSDEFDKGSDTEQKPEGEQGDGARTWEGNLGKHKFRMRMEQGEGRTGFEFKGPFTGDEGESGRDFRFQWERGKGASTSGEYEARLNDLRDQAEKVAQRAAEEARKYADVAAKKVRETDWEAVGHEVRTTIEKAMGDLEDAFGRVRRDWGEGSGAAGGSNSGGSTGSSARGSSGSNSGPQRVRIERDDEGDAFNSAASATATQNDREAQRRDVLELLRSGAITLDEAERRLNGLR